MTLIDTSSIIKSMKEIEPNQIYTTEEARNFLRVSESTIKRYLKKGILRANKIGGRYRILGKEILRLVSPKAEIKTVDVYHKFKEKMKKKIEKW